MKTINKISLLTTSFALTLSILISPIKAESNTKENKKSAVDALRQEMASRKKLVIFYKKTLDIMESAAATQRLDAAILLIDALKYNFSPYNSNEILPQEALIPAIWILKKYYGTNQDTSKASLRTG